MATPATTPVSYAPTRKWIVTQITALAALAVMAVTTGSWDAEETVALIGLVTQASISYLTPNNLTTGGAPENPPNDYVNPEA